MTMTRMNHCTTRTWITASAAATAAALVAAPAWGEPEPISAEPVTERLAFGDEVSMTITQRLGGLDPQEVEIEDGSHLTTMRFTIQPGATFPWHIHPGTVLVGIAEGDFVFLFAEDCVEREYTAGQALVDPGDTVHTAYNPSDDAETVVVATLLGAPAVGGLTIPVGAEEAAELDERCGIDTPGEHTH
jgi:quercetin dioxygenase-like cupin family protein